MGKLKECKNCKKKLPIERYSKNGSGKPEGVCKTCRSGQKETIHRKCKQRFVNLLADYRDIKCEKCGYNKSFAALDFHHVGKKTMKVSHQIGKLSAGAFVNGRVNSILREIDQCQILCSNCHRELHEKYPVVI